MFQETINETADHKMFTPSWKREQSRNDYENIRRHAYNS